MNLRSLETGWPFILRSHMISLMSPTLSVVFASSKKTTVLRLGLTSLLICANLSASFTKFVTCSSVIPPCIYITYDRECSSYDQLYIYFKK